MGGCSLQFELFENMSSRIPEKKIKFPIIANKQPFYLDLKYLAFLFLDVS